MSLNFPKVALGNKCCFIKQERLTDVVLPPPERQLDPPVLDECIRKSTRDSSSTSRLTLTCCSLCTHSPGHELPTFCSPDPLRVSYLRSLLEEGDHAEADLLMFCSVCRTGVNKLFALREDVEDVEIKIRSVVKLGSMSKQPLLPTVICKDERPDDDEEEDEVSFGSLLLEKCGDTIVSPSEEIPSAALRETEAESQQRSKKPGAGASDDKIRKKETKRKLPHKHKCNICDHVCITRNGIYKHNRVVHEARKVDSSQMRVPPGEQEVGGRFACPKKKCRSTFAHKGDVSKHLALTHRVRNVTKTCSKGVGSSCHICSGSYADRPDLLKHVKQVHLKRYVRTCATCGKVFQTTYGYRRHANLSSCSQQQEPTCGFCGTSFQTQLAKWDHERVVHRGLPSNRCYFCRKVASSGGLDAHIRIHTLERPFVCDKCGRDFKDPCQLKYHTTMTCGTNEVEKEKVRLAVNARMRKYKELKKKREAGTN